MCDEIRTYQRSGWSYQNSANLRLQSKYPIFFPYTVHTPSTNTQQWEGEDIPCGQKYGLDAKVRALISTKATSRVAIRRKQVRDALERAVAGEFVIFSDIMTFPRHVATWGHMPPPITHMVQPAAIRRIVTWPGSHQTFILRARRHGTPAVHRLFSLYISLPLTLSLCRLAASRINASPRDIAGILLYSCRYTRFNIPPPPPRSCPCTFSQWRPRRGTLFSFCRFCFSANVYINGALTARIEDSMSLSKDCALNNCIVLFSFQLSCDWIMRSWRFREFFGGGWANLLSWLKKEKKKNSAMVNVCVKFFDATCETEFKINCVFKIIFGLGVYYRTWIHTEKSWKINANWNIAHFSYRYRAVRWQD